jgi:hypothetical protein
MLQHWGHGKKTFKMAVGWFFETLNCFRNNKKYAACVQFPNLIELTIRLKCIRSTYIYHSAELWMVIKLCLLLLYLLALLPKHRKS